MLQLLMGGVIMLKIENRNGFIVYTIRNKYINENGALNEKNVCKACLKYKERKKEEAKWSKKSY